MITKMAFRNIERNRKRTWLTITAIAISVTLIIIAQGYMDGMMGGAMDNFIRFQAGNIKILHREYTENQRLLPLNLAVSKENKIEKNILSWPGIKAVSPKIVFGVILNVNDKNEPCLGTAIDPVKEKDFNNISKYVAKGEYINSGQKEMLVGSLLADKLGLKVGDQVTIVTKTVYDSIAFKTFKLKGIVDTGIAMIDKATFYIPLDIAQQMLDMDDTATEILVLLKDEKTLDRYMEKTTAYLNATDKDLSAISYKKFGGFYELAQSGKAAMYLMSLIILLVSGLTITNTMLMSVFERTKEVGMMKSMGMKNLKIIWLFVLEAIFMGVVAGIIGGILGGLVTSHFAKTGINFGKFIQNIGLPIKTVVYFNFSLKTIVASCIFAIMVTVLSAFYPSIRTTKLLPTEAMRDK